jgi:DNA-binding SARP family transcriptional activator
LRVGVLGPLRIELGGRLLTPSAPKLRQVLALLLLNANHMVPVPVLLDELWHERPPVSARTTLQTYVLHLRRMLGTTARREGGAGNDLLTTEPGGYRMWVAEGELDLHDYHALLDDGAEALDAEDWSRAAEAYGRGRSLWRGPALVDVHVGSRLQPLVQALNETHMTAVERYVEASLRCGRHRDLVSDLTGLVARHRYHERLHAYLMLALHRSGRRHDALRAYQQLRSTLIQDLGFEPSASLRTLQNSILADAPALGDLSIIAGT